MADFFVARFFPNIEFLKHASIAHLKLAWLVETSLIIGLLTIFVLLIRKPVARNFGAKAAYGLWLLPFGRFFLPELAVLQPPADTVLSQQNAVVLMPQSTFEVAAISTPAHEGFTIAQIVFLLWSVCALLWFIVQLSRQALYHQYLYENSKPADLDVMRAQFKITIE